jgi:hypothetical protein
MRRRTGIVAVTVALGLLAAGCATSVAGRAEANAAALAAAQAGSSTPATSGSEPSLTLPSSTSDSSTAPSTDVTTDTSTTESSAGSSSSSSSGGGAGDTGDYPTTPQSLPATPASATDAALLEARRIADSMPVPTLIDKTYSVNVLPTLPLKGPQALASLVFSDPTPTVAQRQGMVTGFVTARRTADSASSVVLGAFEFPDDAKATAAVKPLADSVKSTDFGDKAVTVPGYKPALGWTGHNASSGYRTQVFIAQGQLVLYAYTEDTAKTDQPARIKTLLDAMSAGYKSFVATPSAELTKLPTDTDGMVAHTVPNTGDNATVIDGVYTATGALNYDSDPATTSGLYKSAGVDLVSFGASNVIRARDADGATAVRDGFIDETRAADSKWQPTSIQGVPDSSSCLQQALSANYYCVATSGRYMIEVNAQSETQAVQLLNAQSVMLEGF